MSKVNVILSDGKKDRKKLFWMVCLFSFLVVVLNLLAWKVARNGYMLFFELLTAKTANYLISFSGIKTNINGAIISLPNETWIINTECTALFVMIIFSSFIVTYQANLKQKTIALLVGIPAIFIANISRLLILAWLTQLKMAYAKYFHDYVWQIAFILLVVFFWLIWIDRVISNESKASFSS